MRKRSPRMSKAELLARNPVARASAWKSLKSYAVDAKVRMYSLGEGQDCEEWAMPVARYLTMTLVGAEFDRREQDPDWRIHYLDVQIAQQAIALMSQRDWKFEQAQLKNLEAGFNAAERMVPLLTPDAVNYAWQKTH